VDEAGEVDWAIRCEIDLSAPDRDFDLPLLALVEIGT
jgi:hypothetical protein